MVPQKLLLTGFLWYFFITGGFMKIFLIAGKARSGKGEVAKAIKTYYNQKKQKTVITEYSKYVKLFAREMTEWDGNPKTKPRKFLQDMGVFIRQNLKMPYIFIERMLQDLRVYEKFFDNIVISDVRYPKEIDELKRNFPEVYSLFIINEHGEYDLTVEEANHETEHALDDYDDFDYVIVNDEKEALNKKLTGILNEIEEETEK